MTYPALKDCDKCSGVGTLPRDRRKMENGEFDPADFRTRDLCDKCGASGKIPQDYASVKERTPGNIADQI